MNMRKLTVCAAFFVLIGFAANAGDRAAADAFMAGVPDLYKEGQYDKAEAMCRRAIGADDTCPNAHFQLGSCLEKLNKPRDAFKEYQLAASYATKEKDGALASKANAAAKKIGQGLLEISNLDQKLIAKLVALGQEALDAEQYDTAKSAFASVLALDASNDKAKEGQQKATEAIEKRGDPVRGYLAQAMLGEMWYYIGIGGTDNKARATELAKGLSSRFGDTDNGKEAAQLLANNFQAPKADDLKELTKKLKETAAKKKAVPAVASTPPKADPTKPSPTPPPASAGGPKQGVDVAALEKIAEEDAKKMPKDKLVSTFKETFAKGKDFYSKATPGTEGNQIAVASALEQFIRCEAFFVRIEEEKLVDPSVMDIQKQSSMLRYACMKMTILSH